VSHATSEGGKAGVRTEASRSITAWLIAEGRARVATSEEADDYYQAQNSARQKVERDESARRVQVVLVQAPEAPAAGLPRQTEALKQKDKA
jgi:endonuclease YncB( thermonuclease family)